MEINQKEPFKGLHAEVTPKTGYGSMGNIQGVVVFVSEAKLSTGLLTRSNIHGILFIVMVVHRSVIVTATLERGHVERGIRQRSTSLILSLSSKLTDCVTNPILYSL